jgi:hypothetical protein
MGDHDPMTRNMLSLTGARYLFVSMMRRLIRNLVFGLTVDLLRGENYPDVPSNLHSVVPVWGPDFEGMAPAITFLNGIAAKRFVQSELVSRGRVLMMAGKKPSTHWGIRENDVDHLEPCLTPTAVARSTRSRSRTRGGATLTP